MGRLKRCRRSGTSLDSQKQFIELMKWMKQNGFKSSKLLKPANFSDTGRGMMATREICSGDCLVSIPRKLLITTRTVLDSYLGPFIKAWTEWKLTPRQILAIFLMCEKQLDGLSSWKPYLETLPTSYTVPAFWNEVPDHASCSLKKRIKDHIEEAQQAYKSCLPFLEHLGHNFPVFKTVLTSKLFLWGWFTVQTRGVHFEQVPNSCLAPERDHYALAPYLDLLNHSPHAKVQASFNDVTQYYEIRSLSMCRKYDQVFITYGPHDNTTLLLEYGFVANENPHNVVKFTIDDIQSSIKLLPSENQPECIKKQLKILERQNLTRDLACSLDGPSWNLVVVLRILLMKPAEMKNWALALHNTFSEEHQQNVRNCLRLCLKQKLGSYPTDEDLQRFASSLEVSWQLVTQLMKQQVDILKTSLSLTEELNF